VSDEKELAFRELWQLFYKTIEVEGRHNETCRMSHMPKRYWKYMTEFYAPQSGSKEWGKANMDTGKSLPPAHV
jgi:hypothetical protein